jgi:serine protease Do
MVVVTPPGTQVQLKVIRDGREKDITVKLGELPEKTAVKSEKETEGRLGLTVQNITPQIADRFNLEEKKGVVITEVDPGSIADEVGLQPGDVILEIGGRPIHNIDDYKRAIGGVVKGKSTLFLVKRGENTMYVGIQIG